MVQPVEVRDRRMPTAEEVMHPYFLQIEEAVLNAAPERIDELVARIFRRERWALIARVGAPVGGINPFEAFPNDQRIELSYTGLAMVWCIAVYAGLALDIVREARGRLVGPIDVRNLFGGARRYLKYATELRTLERDWPRGLYVPRLNRLGQPFQTIDGLFFGAVSWLLLHEIAHVHFQHPRNLLPIENIRQEDDADRFAARWMFNEVPSNDERERRTLKVGVALAWLLLFEPWGGDANHPPVVQRMMHVADYFRAQQNSIALEVVAHLFKVLFFPTVKVPAAEFRTSQELFEWTVRLFRNR
jgi:hypothetical protein